MREKHIGPATRLIWRFLKKPFVFWRNLDVAHHRKLRSCRCSLMTSLVTRHLHEQLDKQRCSSPTLKDCRSPHLCRYVLLDLQAFWIFLSPAQIFHIRIFISEYKNRSRSSSPAAIQIEYTHYGTPYVFRVSSILDKFVVGLQSKSMEIY